MITCHHCGHANALGTVYCHSCGQKMQVAAADIFGSIQQTQSAVKQGREFRLGRSLLVIGLFTLLTALMLRGALVPTMPEPLLPKLPATPVNELLPAEQAWVAAKLRPGSAASGGVAQTPAGELLSLIGQPPIDPAKDLLAWRAQHAAELLSGLGPATAQIRGWQRRIATAAEADGGYLGADRIAATGLACLALQAWPGDADINAAAARARAWLKARSSSLLRGEGSDLALALHSWALIEVEGAAALGQLQARMQTGSAGLWQLFALLHLSPAQRPREITVIGAALAEDPIGRALLAIYRGETASVSSDELLAELPPERRPAWALANWLLVADLQQFFGQIESWTADPAPEPSGPDFSLQTGAQTDFALAVLASTATLRLPSHWRGNGP